MFNGHEMSVITDLNMIANEINNIDFITVAAITSEGNYTPHPNIYNASVLMPPTQLLMDWADGNYKAMQNIYPRYLLSKDPDDMIIALIAAMTKKNIVLYIPKEEFSIFGELLLNHLYYVYGITCNFGMVKFRIDQSRIPFIFSKFYLSDFMDANSYLEAYPGNVELPDFVINKLAMELHPFNVQTSFIDYKRYFNELNASKIATRPLTDMVSIVNKG